MASVHRDEVGLQCTISVKLNCHRERAGVVALSVPSSVSYKHPIQTSLMDSWTTINRPDHTHHNEIVFATS